MPDPPCHRGSGAPINGQEASSPSIRFRPHRPKRNLPGGIFRGAHGPAEPVRVPSRRGLGARTRPRGDADYELGLRRKRYPLPFVVKLIDFRRICIRHLDGQAFSSKVAVSNAAGERS